jgi:3-oxoacyl-[acyl-carrier protein] reductase
MSDLQGRIALITGSGQGIGRQIALELAKRGANIITNDITGCCADDVLEEVRALGGDGLAFTADVSSAEQVNDMVKEVLDKYGQIDILVNNAGTTRDNLIVRMDEDDWDLIQRVNLKSAWLCSKAVTRPMMRKKWGRLITAPAKQD